MRRLVLTPLTLSLALGLAACGKSSTQSQNQGAQATAPAQPSNPQATQASEPSAADLKAIQTALPAPYNAADLANGQAKFALCASCHTVAPGGPNMTGPHLHDVVGRKAGSLPDYNYSEGLKAAGFSWDGPHLDTWLANPRGDIPGTKMSFVGLKDPKDRADVIAYLMVNSAPAK